MSDFNQAKYIQQYQKEKYDRCIFNVPKGYKTVLEAHYKAKGYKSLNAYVNALIKADMIEEKCINVQDNKGVIVGDNKGTINNVVMGENKGGISIN